ASCSDTCSRSSGTTGSSSRVTGSTTVRSATRSGSVSCGRACSGARTCGTASGRTLCRFHSCRKTYDRSMTATFLHTMVRITDPDRSRAFYEALGFIFERDMDIVRNGEKEATNYFFSMGEAESVLELTFNHDGRTYEMGTGYGHIAVGVDDLDSTLARL